MTIPMIIVVRGRRTTVDPFFQCASHTDTLNSYAVLEVDKGGKVTGRTVHPASRRRHIEHYCRRQPERIVYIDRRRDAGLVPEPHVDGSRCASSRLATMRLQKSAAERQQLCELDRTVQALIRSVSPETFRKSAASASDGCFAYERRTPHFLQRHYGLRRRGLCADVADVSTTEPLWSALIAHAQSCLVRLQTDLVVGAHVETVEEDFVRRMSDGGCRVRSRPVRHIGYEADEPAPDGAVGEHEVLSLTACFDDGTDGRTPALLRRVCHPGTYRGASEATTTGSDVVGIDEDSFSVLSPHCETAASVGEALRMAMLLLWDL